MELVTPQLELVRKARESLDRGQFPLDMLSSRDVFEMERTNLWPRVWHFLGHESEVQNPGDYVLRYIGPHDQVILSRGEDGRLRGFLNVCRHRGRAFSKAEKGNAAFFRCPYHFWTYSNKGELVGVPQDDTFRIDRREYGLLPVKVESYRGFVFGNLDGKADSLEDYLGEFKWYFDIAARGGELEVYGNPIRYIAHTNWKAAAENFGSDSYHIYFTHRSLYQVGINPLKLEDLGLSPPPGVKKTEGFGGYQFSSPKGHGGGITSFYTVDAENLAKVDEVQVDPKIYEVYPPNFLEEMSKHLTPEQVRAIKMEMLTLSLFRVRVFPNFMIIITSSSGAKRKYVQYYVGRMWRPVSEDQTEVYTWCFVPRFADDEYKRESYRQCVFREGGIAGIMTVDDMTNWTSQTENSKGALSSKATITLRQREHEQPISDFPLPHGETKVYREPSDWSPKAMLRRYLEVLEG